MPSSQDSVVWRPDPARTATSAIVRVGKALGLPLDFPAMHAASIADPARFWGAVWRETGIIADLSVTGEPWDEVLVGADRMAPPDPVDGPAWFPGARLNFAENLLRHDGDGDGDAIVAWDERGPSLCMSWAELRRDSAAFAAALRAMGVVAGDRVAGWLPNIPAAVVAMLGAASIGAVWTSCSPDFGVEGIVDRFGQTRPVVLLFCDGYLYAGKEIDCAARAGELLRRLPSVQHAIMIRHVGQGVAPADARVHAWDQVLDAHRGTTPAYLRLPFDHPLYILYSSGTTGLPKCLVHGAGGTLIQHLKEHQLHCDLRAGDRLFYFTTCGWMMWNWQVSALASGVTLVLYDGAALPKAEPDILWRLAAEERVDVFGTSAKYLALAEKAGLEPATKHDLRALRAVLSTGSPLAPASFDWIGTAVASQAQICSISGGTDIVSCFVLGNPLTPVYRGEIQGPGLGLAVEVFDRAGERCAAGVPGELVCTQPFPSMPVGLWGDADGSRYRAAYFSDYPGVWRHGDWIARTTHGGFVISGRSDTTLNPGGVRIGTAEIYRVIEAMPEVVESVVVGQQLGGEGGDERVILFVRLRSDVALGDELVARIKAAVRQSASPHHVPRAVAAVSDIPRTRSGKLSEVAVRDAIHGRPIDNLGALANPEALEQFRQWGRSQRA